MNKHDIRVRPDKIGSVCLPLQLPPYITVRRDPEAAEGTSIVCRVLTARREYGHLELESGRQALLVPGDIIVGVLGSRAALRGFCGRPPEKIEAGDEVHLLNQGGVIGVSAGDHVGLGEPIRLQVLGTPVREGAPLRLADYAIQADETQSITMPPILVVAGTCMHAGKSTAAAVIIRYLRSAGLVVHAGKATGVASIQDPMRFLDSGAQRVLTFLDCGLPSTCYRSDIPQVAHQLLVLLAQEQPDVIVLEMGDGLMGAYGVDEIVADSGFSKHVWGALIAANDIIGAAAAARQLQDRGIPVRAITGPATDNPVGIEGLARQGFEAANIFHEPERLCALATQGLIREEVIGDSSNSEGADG